MRDCLIRMYLASYGEDNVNPHWLAVLSDEEIEKSIVNLAKLGHTVSDATIKYNGEQLRVTVGAYRSSINNNKGEK